jgi:hypothetical protein
LTAVFGTGRYLGSIPKRVAPDRTLMHNHVKHIAKTPCNYNGFRAWTDIKPPDGFVERPCGWSGLTHYARRDHVERNVAA